MERYELRGAGEAIVREHVLRVRRGFSLDIHVPHFPAAADASSPLSRGSTRTREWTSAR